MANWKTLGFDFVTLRVFKAAVEEESFVRAAEREHLAPSAISRRISEFESRLEIPLLRRHDRGVEPTIAGEILMRHVKTLFDVVDQALNDLSAISEGKQGRVRLYANLSSINSDLPGILGEFSRQNPLIDIVLEQHNSSHIIRMVENGLADFGIISGSTLESELTFLDLYVDKLVAVLPAGHSLASCNEPLHFVQILDNPFVGLSKSMALQALIREKSTDLGKNLNECINIGSYELVLRFVGEGMGVSIVPMQFVDSNDVGSNIVARPLLDDWASRPLKLCMKSSVTLAPSAKLLLQYILDAYLQENRTEKPGQPQLS